MASSRKAVRAVDAQGLLKHLHHFLENHLPPKARITLGLSGGLDSCVLLHLLAQLRQSLDFQLSAIHVNHQISPNADMWQHFCGELCSKLGVSFNAVWVTVPRDTGLGLEAAARMARYQALLEHCDGALVLAHHSDDQAETVMLQLLRGAGVAGLAAMPSERQLGNVEVLRPMLNLPRTVLHHYAQEHGILWIEDESNLDTRFDRNFLRNEVFPVLARRFPAYASTLSRSALNFADSAEILEQIAAQDAVDACLPGKLNISVLSSLPQVRAANVLRWWVNLETGQALSRSGLYEILKQLTQARADARIECNLGDKTLRRYRQWAWMDTGKLPEPYCIKWHGEMVLQLPDGSSLVMEGVDNALVQKEFFEMRIRVTNRLGKPDKGKLQIRLAKNRPIRSLKNVFQEFGIPPWKRDHIPLLWCDLALIAIPGIGVAEEYKNNWEGIRPIWVTD